MKRTLCVGLAALCLTRVAPALADVHVTYLVDDKALKAAVTGTNLMFTLFSDSGCTMPVGSPITTAVDTVLIERLKVFVPKGGTKPPATDRLGRVFVGSGLPAGPYMIVTGTGIKPVGGSCQFQFSVPPSGTSLPCASQVGTDVFFTGCNVNIRSGSGSTDGPINGTGNLIVGYNANDGSRYRPGSHNIVVGDEQSYQSYGGLVAGFANTISGPFASVTGGNCNVAGYGPAPLQGCAPANSGPFAASVSGGGANVASGTIASVSGGASNTASGNAAAVSGGLFNSATGFDASASGGVANVAGPDPGMMLVYNPSGESVS